jgi:tetratricopeptide (TPR) repeat protein
MTPRACILQAVLVAALVCPPAAVAQDSLGRAAQLYASASYDEALAVIDRLNLDSMTPGERLALNQQRALCLLALGRVEDAEAAIAAVVEVDPTYRPDASPRVRQAFRDVRNRLLPAIVQSEYVEARRLYDAGSWAEAGARFTRVATLAADADLTAGTAAMLSDLRVLAEGFATLSAKAAEPPPEPETSAEAAAPGPPPPDYDSVFDGTEPRVVAPVTLVQDLPRWPAGQRQVPRAPGLLDIVIGKNGIVERATMRQRIVAFYDRLVLQAVSTWRYEPAQLDGQPVRFTKTIKIAFQ